MDRRRLQLGGMTGMLQPLQGQTPMTGSGAEAPDKGDASQQDMDTQPPDGYVVPARPSVLAHEAGDTSQHPLMQLMRRRVDNGFGPRRLG